AQGHDGTGRTLPRPPPDSESAAFAWVEANGAVGVAVDLAFPNRWPDCALHGHDFSRRGHVLLLALHQDAFKPCRPAALERLPRVDLVAGRQLHDAAVIDRFQPVAAEREEAQQPVLNVLVADPQVEEVADAIPVFAPRFEDRLLLVVKERLE